MKTTEFINQIRALIAENELNTALTQLRLLLDNSPRLDEAILQTARFQDIRKQVRLGVVSRSEADLTQNQIRTGLLELLDEIESQGAAPALQREIEKAVTKEYNKNLTRSLVEAMRIHNDKAEKLCKDFSWLDHPENRRKVQQFVFQNFVGEIGKQLRKLVNIGDDEQMERSKKEYHYVQKCLDIARRSLDLVNYTLLSVWWDASKTGSYELEEAGRQVLTTFFEDHLEQRLEKQFELLQTLCALFSKHKLTFPFAEQMDSLQAQLHPGSALHQACTALEAAVKSADCTASETQLAALLQHFAFLTRYRMVSLKRISYRQLRNGKPEYLHRYVALGIDVKYSEDAEKGRWGELGEQTPAVLLYKGDDYQNGINLFPFVIDYNALTFEQGAKICFYSARDLTEEGTLEYRFLGDNSIIRIEKKGVHTPQTKLDDLMMNTDLLKALNLDCVVDGFHEARLTILHSEQDDLFNNL